MIEWKVEVKRSRDRKSVEVSVINSKFDHGFKSWGWFGDRSGEEKICILSVSSLYQTSPVAESVVQAAIVEAEKIASQKNAKSGE